MEVLLLFLDLLGGLLHLLVAFELRSRSSQQVLASLPEVVDCGAINLCKPLEGAAPTFVAFAFAEWTLLVPDVVEDDPNLFVGQHPYAHHLRQKAWDWARLVDPDASDLLICQGEKVLSVLVLDGGGLNFGCFGVWLHGWLL